MAMVGRFPDRREGSGSSTPHRRCVLEEVTYDDVWFSDNGHETNNTQTRRAKVPTQLLPACHESAGRIRSKLELWEDLGVEVIEGTRQDLRAISAAFQSSKLAHLRWVGLSLAE